MTFRVPRETVDLLKARADTLGITMAEFIRRVVERELGVQGNEARFLRELQEWWVLGGQGDPSVLQGAIARAGGQGMSFSLKFRNGIRTLLDHGIL